MGGMKGSDSWILVQNSKTGEWTIRDSFATTFALPDMDDSQDVTLVSSPPPSNVSTVYKFSRLLSTCDKQDRAITMGDVANVIWYVYIH
jgi:hypothetical protein